MGDKIIILKETKDGIVKDTIYQTEDTISIDISGSQTIVMPSDPIDVNTPGKDVFDYALGTVTILGAIIAGFYTLKSIRKLYKKDEDKQAQIDKLSSIAEKMEAQNKILEEGNLLISKQVDVLRNLTVGSNDNEASQELLRIEQQKLELEHRPRLYSNMFSYSFNTGKFKVENGGKPLTIDKIECDNDNIIIENQASLTGKYLEEHGFVNIMTRTRNDRVMKDQSYIIKIFVENDINNKYRIDMHSQKMDSLRNAAKIEE
ncbi:hypothetical protein K6119_15810 [Paracrocinitomix mangrovi]|uniref:hypothetical protein n=1 Tax=Paracrocinitomix mangrovi TaxID=2862509 RepID=UPI001C8DC2E2|nr:hypothetical protein [Paracrocinitomix mangrovi]UKN01196.1 hypothetical protein K6119_15810 [Paracrocinitomix mangrovi]